MVQVTYAESMVDDPKYGAYAQTPAQRAAILVQLEKATPGIVSKANEAAHCLYQRYVAGELSWTQVRELRDACCQSSSTSFA